jgi:UDP-glucose 4-epimerase
MTNNFRKACITGGAGFIGSKLARQLLDQGMAVTVLDNLSVGIRENVPSDANLIVGDILNPADCQTALKECDILFHLAARVAIRSSFDFVVEDTMCNVVGTASILREAIRIGSVRKIVSASSMGVYADSSDTTPISESHPVIPISPYGISKFALEQLTHRMAGAAGLESICLRLFNTYGPGQRLSPYVGVITIFINRLRAGKPVTIFGDGMQARDFVHVDDVVSGFMAAMNSGIRGETCNIGTGVPHTVNQVFELLSAALKSSIRPTYAPVAHGELRFSIASIEKAREVLGYQPKNSFEEALPRVVSEVMATKP